MSDTTPTPPPVVTEGDRAVANELVDRLNDCIVSDYDHDGESHELSWAAVDMLAAAIAQAREEGAEDTRRLDWLSEQQIRNAIMEGLVPYSSIAPDMKGVIAGSVFRALRATIDAFREERG